MTDDDCCHSVFYESCASCMRKLLDAVCQQMVDQYGAADGQARYPTVHAYEKVCAANERRRQRIEDLEAENQRQRDGLNEAGKHVESVIVMRTAFNGEPPYVGWRGLGLALTERLDELEADNQRLHDALWEKRFAAGRSANKSDAEIRRLREALEHVRDWARTTSPELLAFIAEQALAGER